MDYTLRLKWWSAGQETDRYVTLSGEMDTVTFSLSAVAGGEGKLVHVETGNALWSYRWSDSWNSTWQGLKFVFHLTATAGATPEQDLAHLLVRVGVPRNTKPSQVVLLNGTHEEVFAPRTEDEDMSIRDREFCDWYACKQELRRR